MQQQRGGEAGQRGREERVQEGEDQDHQDVRQLSNVQARHGWERKGQGSGSIGQQGGDPGTAETRFAHYSSEERGPDHGRGGRDPREKPETVLRVRGEGWRVTGGRRQAGLPRQPEQLHPREHPSSNRQHRQQQQQQQHHHHHRSFLRESSFEDNRG